LRGDGDDEEESEMFCLIKLCRTTAILTLLIGMGLAGSAHSTPIKISPSPATVNATVGKYLILRLDSGDSVTKTLNFTAKGAGPCGFPCPSNAVALIVFDGMTVLATNDIQSGLFSSGKLVRGFVKSKGSVAELMIQMGAPSSKSIGLSQSSIPTTATLSALNLVPPSSLDATHAVRSNVQESSRITFSASGGSHPVPEPSATFLFGSGLLVAALAIRRPA